MKKIYGPLEAKVMSFFLGIGVVWSVIAILFTLGTTNSTELFLDFLCLPINLGLLFMVNLLTERPTNQHVEVRKKRTRKIDLKLDWNLKSVDAVITKLLEGSK